MTQRCNTGLAHMSQVSYLHRRGAVYYWRRRLGDMAPACPRGILAISLATKDLAVARRRGAEMTMMSEELTARVRDGLLSPDEAQAILKTVARRHARKLDAIARVEKADGAAGPANGARGDRIVGAVYRIVAMKGIGAGPEDIDEAFLTRCGLDPADKERVITTLDQYRRQGLIPPNPAKLAALIEEHAPGKSPTGMNILHAQEAYLRGMATACFMTQVRWGDKLDADIERFGDEAVQEEHATTAFDETQLQAATHFSGETYLPPATHLPPATSDAAMMLGAAGPASSYDRGEPALPDTRHPGSSLHLDAATRAVTDRFAPNPGATGEEIGAGHHAGFHHHTHFHEHAQPRSYSHPDGHAQPEALGQAHVPSQANPHLQTHADDARYAGGHAVIADGPDHYRHGGHVPPNAPHAPEPPRHWQASLASDPSFPDIAMITESLISQKLKGRAWTTKTASQARHTARLFTRITGIDDIRQVRQHHIAQFTDTLLLDMPRNYGRSSGDATRPMSEIIAMARLLPEDERGLNGATINRHLTALHSIFDFAKARGIVPAATISLTALRTRKSKRDRDARSAFSVADLITLFGSPVWMGSASVKRRLEPGSMIVHDAEYWVPLIGAYSLMRREEICGLMLDEVAFDAPIPYFDIKVNKYRRIKNAQSERKIHIHPELLRLGLEEYCRQIAATGYDLVFPELYGDNPARALGNAFDRGWNRILKQALPDARERKLVFHSLRHFGNNELLRQEVMVEWRQDLLGQGGQSEAGERYREAISLDLMLSALRKIPCVTAGVEPAPINLRNDVRAHSVNRQRRPRR